MFIFELFLFLDGEKITYVFLKTHLMSQFEKVFVNLSTSQNGGVSFCLFKLQEEFVWQDTLPCDHKFWEVVVELLSLWSFHEMDVKPCFWQNPCKLRIKVIALRLFSSVFGPLTVVGLDELVRKPQELDMLAWVLCKHELAQPTINNELCLFHVKILLTLHHAGMYYKLCSSWDALLVCWELKHFLNKFEF